MSESRFNPHTTYFSRDKLAESAFSIFLTGLFFPRRMFANMPATASMKESAMLLAMYLAVPSILMTTTFGAVASSMAPNAIAGALIFISILPVSLLIGLSTSLLWSKWLSWSLSRLTGRQVSLQSVFQVCAYSGPPFVIAWGPYLGPVMALWNLLLNWKGLKYYCRVTYGQAFLAIVAGITLLSLLIAGLALLLVLIIPENVNMLLESLALMMQQRGWL